MDYPIIEASALMVAIVGACIACMANTTSKQAYDLARHMSAKEVFDLWQRARFFKADSVKFPERDFLISVEVLELTAIFWRFSIADRTVLHEYAWPRYKDFYDEMAKCSQVTLSSDDRQVRDYLTGLISEEYMAMANYVTPTERQSP